MTTMLERPAPVLQPAPTDDDDELHIYCCDPSRALCGEMIFGDLVEDPDGKLDDETCPRCLARDEAIIGVSCGAPFCRLRQRIRGWRR